MDWKLRSLFATLALASALACSAPTVAPSCEPSADGERLPDSSFEGFDERGAAGAVRLRDYAEPCAARPRLLVVRVVGGAFAGTSRWHASHTASIRASAPPRVRWLDVVSRDRDGGPVTPSAIVAWRALVSDPTVATAADSSSAFLAIAARSSTILPLHLLVDTRTLRVVRKLANPSAIELEQAIARALAEMDGAPPPPSTSEPLVDGLFQANEWDLVADMRTPGAPPPDPTNAAADDSRAAALGKSLFFDPGLSSNGALSCASCHDPKMGLSDGLPNARGVAQGTRRTPATTFAAFSPYQLWDGGADTLWGQALGPIENPVEMGSSRIETVRRIASTHRAAFQTAFPDVALPALDGLPPSGKPGDASWAALPVETRSAVTHAFASAGKAIAAYERTFRAAPDALDAYASGKFDAFDDAAKQGLVAFLRVGCVQCHYGPRLTDDAFHVSRLGGADDPDLGREGGSEKLAGSEFRASGPWSDAPAPAVAMGGARGAFKTPSLRATHRAAFGHRGVKHSIVEVTEAYGAAKYDSREPWLPVFPVTTQWALVPFLDRVGGEPIVP